MKKNIEISLKYNGKKLEICQVGTLEDFAEMTEHLINMNNQDNVKIFMAILSTIVKTYKVKNINHELKD